MTAGSDARPGPKLGLILPLFSGDLAVVVATAREAETLGFDGVFVFDHFFPPGSSPTRPSLEAFTTIGQMPYFR